MVISQQLLSVYFSPKNCILVVVAVVLPLPVVVVVSVAVAVLFFHPMEKATGKIARFGFFLARKYGFDFLYRRNLETGPESGPESGLEGEGGGLLPPCLIKRLFYLALLPAFLLVFLK